MSGRRTDTRERIQQVALELFAERGYEKTSLREVADRLEITRPALYYHFKTKEDILNGIIGDLAQSIDDLLTWAKAQPTTTASRLQILHRVADLIDDQWRPLIRFAQVNQAVMRDIPAGEQMQERMFGLLSVFTEPGGDDIRQLEARLAVVALIIGSAPQLLPDVSDDRRAEVTRTVAERLLGLQSP
jgi:AcrR family transcriptional regulator